MQLNLRLRKISSEGRKTADKEPKFYEKLRDKCVFQPNTAH